MIGEYVMTQHDITGSPEHRSKSDSIAVGAHYIDSHHVQRVALSPTSFCNEGRVWQVGDAYEIPYRALLPKADQADNLLVPGPASFSHVAYCTYRLESTWMTTGQAAGLAAVLAGQAGISLRDVSISQLQQQLKRLGQTVHLEDCHPIPKAWQDRMIH